MNSSEVQFLASQQARLDAIKSSQRSEHADAIHSFWERLRTTLSQWETRVDQLCLDKPKQNAHQLLLDLKLELQQLQKHCLGSVVVVEDWEVPVLPVADLRLLHNTFAKHLQKWETAQHEIAPKGKFVFRRYREEVARRKAAQQTITHAMMADGAKLLVQANANNNKANEGALLQDLNEASIVIATDGSVRVDDQIIELKISEAALLVRKLKKCSLIIRMKLMTLHIVDSADTQIIVQQLVGSAIHVTGCHSCQLQASGQQLRLHDSTHLHCQVHIGAGAILEDCQGIVFAIAAYSSIDVRDFNWLRAGEPSPNYEIIKVEPTEVAAETIIQDGSTESVEQPSLNVHQSEAVAPSEKAPQEAVLANTTAEPPAEEDSDDDDEL